MSIGTWHREDAGWELSGCGVLSHVLGLVTISRSNILLGLYLEKTASVTPRGLALGLPS